MCKRAQQLLTLLHPQCWELLRACWHLCANGCNNSQQVAGRSLCNPFVMSVRGPNNVGRAVQMDPTLLCYASAIMEQKKCWELLAEKLDQFQILPNNMQQGVQMDATCNIQQCCVRLHRALRIHSLSSLWCFPCLGSYNLRFITSFELKVPKTKCKTLGDRTFACLGPSLWSTLPSAIRSIRSVQGLKQALKTFLFPLAFAQ